MGKNDRRKPDAPGPQGTMAKFMEPCLLLLLKQESSHGYELMEKLSPFGFEGTSSDMATLYRTLRQLEDAGIVTSEWEEGSQGPRRRVYEITEAGYIFLDDWVSIIRGNRERLTRFLGAYDSTNSQGE